MSIAATCPTCGKGYKLADQLAGRTVRCKQCNGTFVVGAAQVAPAIAAPEPAPAFEPEPLKEPESREQSNFSDLANMAASQAKGRTLTYARPGFSRARMLAGRSCIVVAVLGYAFTALMLCAGFLILGGATASGRRGIESIAAAVALIFAVLFGGISTTLLICGIQIRKGGFASLIIALVLACLSEVVGLLDLIMVLGGVVIHGGDNIGPALLLQLGLKVLFVGAFGQLIYYIVATLREPRVS